MPVFSAYFLITLSSYPITINSNHTDLFAVSQIRYAYILLYPLIQNIYFLQFLISFITSPNIPLFAVIIISTIQTKKKLQAHFIFKTVLAALRCMWDFSSPSRHQTRAPCTESVKLTTGLPGRLGSSLIPLLPSVYTPISTVTTLGSATIISYLCYQNDLLTVSLPSFLTTS